jgi:hypothetical protein
MPCAGSRGQNTLGDALLRCETASHRARPISIVPLGEACLERLGNPQLRTNRRVQVFFVCGAPKSGTTWLQRLLDAHPEVCCSGEGHFIDRFAVPMAEVVRRYNAHMTVVGEQVYEGRPHYAPLDQGGFDEIVRAFILQRLAARADEGVRCVGDKTPRYAIDLASLDRLFPQARFINIVRDPRDVVVSQRFHDWRANGAEALVPGGPRRRDLLAVSASDWVRAVKPVEAFAAAHPGRVHTLRYEDLLAGAAREARALFTFLGVAADAEVAARVAAETAFAARTGRAPGQEDPRAFLRRGIAGDWMEKLEPDEVDAVEAECAELMARYGYAPAEPAYRASA